MAIRKANLQCDVENEGLKVVSVRFIVRKVLGWFFCSYIASSTDELSARPIETEKKFSLRNKSELVCVCIFVESLSLASKQERE